MMNAIQNAARALRGGPQGSESGKFFLTYARLKLKDWLGRAVGYSCPKRERVLDFRVEAADYSTLVYLFEEIFLKGDYQFAANGRPPTIIDCGSNIGMSVLFFKRMYPQCRIVAFEPNARAFELLQRNVRENGLEDVELHRHALQGTAGPVNLYYDPAKPCSLRTATRMGRMPDATAETVEGVTLSSYVNARIDLLKMDIEGAESEVIEELARHDRLRLIDQMLVEYHHHVEPHDDRLGRLLTLLEQHGFGYQLSASNDHRRSRPAPFQDILIYAYSAEDKTT